MKRIGIFSLPLQDCTQCLYCLIRSYKPTSISIQFFVLLYSASRELDDTRYRLVLRVQWMAWGKCVGGLLIATCRLNLSVCFSHWLHGQSSRCLSWSILPNGTSFVIDIPLSILFCTSYLTSVSPNCNHPWMTFWLLLCVIWETPFIARILSCVLEPLEI